MQGEKPLTHHPPTLPKKLNFAPRGPLELLNFASMVDLLPSGKTSFNTYRMPVISHSKPRFLFSVKSTKRDSVSYSIILNTNVLKPSPFKISRNGYNASLIVAIKPNTVSGNCDLNKED